MNRMPLRWSISCSQTRARKPSSWTVWSSPREVLVRDLDAQRPLERVEQAGERQAALVALLQSSSEGRAAPG